VTATRITGTKVTGNVLRFNGNFGFIRISPDKPDIYFHVQDEARSETPGKRAPKIGDTLKFFVVDDGGKSLVAKEWEFATAAYIPKISAVTPPKNPRAFVTRRSSGT
jgi:cold shock CspA family protein